MSSFDEAYEHIEAESRGAFAEDTRQKDADFDEDIPEKEDIALGFAIQDVAGNSDVLAATISRVLTRDQISQLVNRLNKTLDL